MWQAQAIFTVYWLLYQTFDILLPHRALLPLNAVGFLGLSLMSGGTPRPAASGHLLAAAQRPISSAPSSGPARAGGSPITLTAALAAAAILLKLDYQWIALALLIEAELFDLAGVRFRAPYLR